MADKYTLDEVNAMLDVADDVRETLKRVDTLPELKARLICPHCRCYDKEVWDQVVLHGVPCRVSCMRGLSQWIEAEAGRRIKEQDRPKRDASCCEDCPAAKAGW